MVADELANRFGVAFRNTKTEALIADIFGEEGRLLLAKPQTFMNNSGRSLKTIASFFKVDPADIIVIHDELDLPFGSVKVKDSGGSAGHNGVQSVIESLGTRDFKRIRIGIGRPPGSMDPADFVLRDFTADERVDLGLVIHEAADAAIAAAGAIDPA
jgi:PTH1 family peptidyl-tRNA hydrolase